MGLDTFSSQPKPEEGLRDVTQLVIADLAVRSAAGKEKYGTVLKAFNGRRADVDLYQELLDAVVYLRQKLEEDTVMGSYQKNMMAFVKAVASLDDSQMLNEENSQWEMRNLAREVIQGVSDVEQSSIFLAARLFF